MTQPVPPKLIFDHNFSFFHTFFFFNGWSNFSPSQQFLDIQNKSKFSVKCHAGLPHKKNLPQDDTLLINAKELLTMQATASP